MPAHPTIREISRSLGIFETLLTENRSLAEMNFAINTIIDCTKYMYDALQDAAAEAGEMVREASNREHELAESNAHREERIDRLRRKVEAKRAVRIASGQELVPHMGKLSGRVGKEKSRKMIVFRKAKFAGKKEVKWKPVIGGAGDVIPDAADIGSG